jgi:sugar lactone lactonase YvrE
MPSFSPTLTHLSRAAMVLAVAIAVPATGSVAAAEPAAPIEHAAITIAGLDLPESAVHDPLTDAYLVSNVGGTLPAAAFAKDGNGFISKIAPDGTVIDREWIGLGRNGVTLDAPKGLAIAGRSLFVADIDVVREFDRFTGKPISTVAIPGAQFLNDVARGPAGSVYVSDTAVVLSDDGTAFVPTEADAIYQVTADGQVLTTAKGPGLGSPNGLTVDRRGQLLVAPFDGSKEIFTPDQNGERRTVRPTPVGQLDGLEELRDGSLIISSAESQSVVRVARSGESTTLFSGLQVADLGIDRRRKRLLLPLLNDGALIIQPFEP